MTNKKISALTGATNNYGFYGAIASGTNRYNLYMSGTAQNYLGGDLKLGSSYTETVYALSGTAIDPANGTIQTKTLSGSTTFTESLADGQSVVLMVNPSTYTVTWPTMTWINTAGSGSAPTLEASSMNVVVIWQVGGTVYGNWAGSA